MSEHRARTYTKRRIPAPAKETTANVPAWLNPEFLLPDEVEQLQAAAAAYNHVHNTIGRWLSEHGPAVAHYMQLVEQSWAFDSFDVPVDKAFGFTGARVAMGSDMDALKAFVEYHEAGIVKAIGAAIARFRIDEGGATGPF
jgi:hypothetical protein